MENDISDSMSLWQMERKSIQETKVSATNSTESEIKEKSKKVSNIQFGNIIVLSLTLIGLILFFLLVAPMETTVSHFGIFLMIGGLIVRILVEIKSRKDSNRIDFTLPVSEMLEELKSYYSKRLHVHHRITVVILLAYTIGFYLLMPEFSLYLSHVWLIGFSYIPAAAVIGFSILSAINREKKELKEIIMLLNNNEDQ